MADTAGNAAYGTETLEILSEAANFNRWMYQTIRPFCHGNILEIGSGIGNISQFFIQDGAAITLSDFDRSYVPRLNERFRNNANLGGVIRIDLSDQDLEKNHPELIGQFDTVFALNVIEHIEDHHQALANVRKLLRAGGKVIILVPAFQWLFNSFDAQLGHYRRYTSKTLKNLLASAGFHVTHSQYFNFIAIAGWFFFGTILRKRIIPSQQMRIYDALVPVWKALDYIVYRITGVSVIQVAVKDTEKNDCL